MGFCNPGQRSDHIRGGIPCEGEPRKQLGRGQRIDIPHGFTGCFCSGWKIVDPLQGSVKETRKRLHELALSHRQPGAHSRGPGRSKPELDWTVQDVQADKQIIGGANIPREFFQCPLRMFRYISNDVDNNLTNKCSQGRRSPENE